MSFHLIGARGRRPANAIPVARVVGGTHDGALLMHTDDESGVQLINLTSGEFTPMPDPREGRRCVYHVVAASGGGKSCFAASFARNLANMFPNHKTFVLSNDMTEDPAYAKIVHTRIPASEDLNSIEIGPLCEKNDATLLIFDDTEAIPDKKDRLALESFQGRALTQGRKHGCHVLSLVHRGADGRATRTSLLESNGLVIFPKHAGGSNLKYMLEKHFNVPGAILKSVKDGFGRWVLIRNDAEPYILGPSRAAIYDQDDVAGALKTRMLAEKKVQNRVAEMTASRMAESCSEEEESYEDDPALNDTFRRMMR